MNQRPILFSMISKTLSKSFTKNVSTTINKSNNIIFNKSSSSLFNNNINKTTNLFTSTSKLQIYKFNINELKNQFSASKNDENNENNENNSKLEDIKDFDKVIQNEIENKLKNSSKHNRALPISGNESHLVFEHIEKYKFKIMFFIGIAQFAMFLFILEEYLVKAMPTSTDFWVVVGGGLLTIVTQLFFRSMGKKQIAAIHTYNKGRVLEITSYGWTGFPNRKRIVNINNLISAPGNDRIASPVSNQDKSFFLKFPGDFTYYQSNLDGSLIMDSKQLDKIIHFSKAEQVIKQTNKMIKKNKK